MTFDFTPVCDRCHKSTSVTTMSYFNTDTICPDCDALEKAHPKYKEAKEAELKAVQAGDYNFPGVGKPDDLVGGVEPQSPALVDLNSLIQKTMAWCDYHDLWVQPSVCKSCNIAHNGECQL